MKAQIKVVLKTEEISEPTLKSDNSKTTANPYFGELKVYFFNLIKSIVFREV